MPQSSPIVSDQLDFSGLHDRVRSKDHDTSWAAAQKIDDKALSKLKRAILFIIGDEERKLGRGITDDELYDEYRRRGYEARAPQRVRTARNEITDPDLLPIPLIVGEDGGMSEFGNAAQLWKLTDAGKAVAA